MKDPRDCLTLEIPAFPLPVRRGRPVTGKAKTNAQRQAEHRQRRKLALPLPSDAFHDELIALRARVRELESDLEQATVDLAYWWAMSDELKVELTRVRGGGQ